MSIFQSLPLPNALNTSSHNFTVDFFEPLLLHSKQYDRAVGFFSSGWLRLNARGIRAMVQQQAKIRWLTSPILDETDWQALLTGDMARKDSVMRQRLDSYVKNLTTTLEHETSLGLAWLVAHEKITFKLAIPNNELLGGDFHDKFGIFTDNEGNQVSFTGSYNDSVQGLRNYESIKVFSSWLPAFAPFVKADTERFESLWNNLDCNVEVYDLAEAARQELVQLRTKEEHPQLKELFVTLRTHHTSLPSAKIPQPALPSSIQLRDYQQEAIEAWFENQCRGLLEMATGTGKTITALTAAVQLMKREKRLIIVIACPFRHLVTQWAQVVEQFGFNTVTTVDSRGWEDEITNQILDFSADYIDNLAILTTHHTCSSPKFTQIIEARGLSPLLIMDEVHDIGAPQRQAGLLACYTYRLGLSATPQRWFDSQGTKILFDYFDHVVFDFPLAKAIPDFLTPYEYFPNFVELIGDELEEYEAITKRITKRAHSMTGHDTDHLLALYQIKRQKIITNTEQKYSCFEQILSSLGQLHHTLVYCSPEQIDHVQTILNRRGIVQSRFTGEESLKERTRLLASFAAGHHQVLVAMKCLDQGVDVPSTQTAILLASSGNPKEFIQRRGRVLRKFAGKKKATIYDIVVVPTLQGTLDPETFELERKIMARELQRYDEFANLSLTRIHALNKIGPIKRKYLVQ